MADAASVLSEHLQSNWSLTAPEKDEVYWAKSKVEAVDFARLGKNYVVACYAPMTAAMVRLIAQKLWQIEQNVMVDLLVRVITTVDEAVNVRENMRMEIHRILETSKPEDFEAVDITREFNKNESMDLARLSLEVKCLNFAVVT